MIERDDVKKLENATHVINGVIPVQLMVVQNFEICGPRTG